MKKILPNICMEGNPVYSRVKNLCPLHLQVQYGYLFLLPYKYGWLEFFLFFFAFSCFLFSSALALFVHFGLPLFIRPPSALASARAATSQQFDIRLHSVSSRIHATQPIIILKIRERCRRINSSSLHPRVWCLVFSGMEQIQGLELAS